MEKLEYKNFQGTIEYSEQDQCFYGKVIGLPHHGITYEGRDIDELRKDFQEAVDCYLQLVCGQGFSSQ